ncbi:histone-like transcription factor and archaeal histone [Stagonosporopsis vannaccii]|nr:histone-like transcription factor and archaeal histone [Stagonosporopsis vannaccii]
MPYNNTPIAPSKEVTGHVSLPRKPPSSSSTLARALTPPVARVQKIIQADPERLTVTKNASFAIALATEMMIQHLAVTTHNVVKAERKPRRNIQYRDVSGAVSKTDNLEFLVDVVPKTTQYGAYRKRKAAEDEEREKARDGEKSEDKGKARAEEKGRNGAQTTLAAVPVQAAAAHEVSARASEGSTAPTAAPQNGTQLDPLARKELVPPVPETEAMDVDGGVEERVADSEGEGEEDPAAMQIEMEMRGPPRQNGKGNEKDESAAPPLPPPPPPPRMSTGGFTAINGR